MFPNHPLGCVPLFHDSGADEICLYYRGAEDPLLAGRSGSDNILHPLDDRSDDFFIAPDRYEVGKHRLFKRAKKNLPGWDALRITDLGNPIEEILKPLDIVENKELFGKEFTPGLMRDPKSRVFEHLLKRLEGLENADPSTECIRRAFVSDSSFQDWFCWYRLGCRLVDLGDWSKAVAVLSNAAFVANATGPLWSKVLMISLKLQDALVAGGPLLYRRQVERWIPWLRKWQEEE